MRVFKKTLCFRQEGCKLNTVYCILIPMRSSKKHLKHDLKFLVVFAGIFFLTFLGLYFVGLVPVEFLAGDPSDPGVNDLKLRVLNGVDNSNSEIQNTPSEEPIYIEIPKVGVNIVVQNPTSKNNNILNEYLLKGAVRYPDSGLIGQGNMLIFGHSAEAYKNIVNPAYKAFNGIENLKVGDEVYVKSENGNYVYKVTNVKLVNASEEQIIFSNDKNTLTLATCNTFGEKQERYVVEAEFEGKE